MYWVVTSSVTGIEIYLNKFSYPHALIKSNHINSLTTYINHLQYPPINYYHSVKTEDEGSITTNLCNVLEKILFPLKA